MNILKYILSKKYRFFLEKRYAVQATIWEMEFKVNKSRQVREGIRLDRDKTVENINQLEATLKVPGKKEEEIKKLESELAMHKSNKERFEKQINMIDAQINGGQQSEDNPAGIGILEQMRSLVELQGMYDDYMSRI
jgi:hypothetical protein